MGCMQHCCERGCELMVDVMIARLWIGLTTIFTCMSLHTVNGAIFTKAPIPMAALINSVANFTCKGTGDVLVWTVAETSLTDSIKEMRDITVADKRNGSDLSSVLTITAIPINDGIKIGCVLASFNPYQLVAEQVNLTIKGVSQVDDIKWFPGSGLLTWSPPSFYSSDDTIFIYNVAVNGICSKNTTKTTIHLNIDCEEFNITIIVYAGEYMSSKTHKMEYNFGNFTIRIVNHTAVLNESNNMVDVSLINLIESSVQLCINESVIYGTVISNKGSIQNYPAVEINSKQGNNKVQYMLTELKLYGIYAVTIFLVDPFNLTEAQDNVTISTYKVQDLIISHENDSVLVRCLFLQGLKSKECHVVFTESTQELEKSFNIRGSVGTLVSLPIGGKYTVRAYDIVNGSIVGPAVEYPLTIRGSVINIEPSFSIFISSEQKSIIYSITQSSFVTTSIPSNHQNQKTPLLISVAVILPLLTIILCTTICMVALFVFKAKHAKRGIHTVPNSSSISAESAENLLTSYKALSDEGLTNNE